jgi:hypothetical protein
VITSAICFLLAAGLLVTLSQESRARDGIGIIASGHLSPRLAGAVEFLLAAPGRSSAADDLKTGPQSEGREDGKEVTSEPT